MIRALVRSLAGRTVAVPDLPAGVAVVRGRWIPELGGRLCGMRGPAAAVTLGSTIVVHPCVDLSSGLLRHELAHVRQWREQPLTFPLVYVWHHFRHGYRANPFEIEARNAEHQLDRRDS